MELNTDLTGIPRLSKIHVYRKSPPAEEAGAPQELQAAR